MTKLLKSVVICQIYYDNKYDSFLLSVVHILYLRHNVAR